MSFSLFYSFLSLGDKALAKGENITATMQQFKASP